MKTKEKIQMKHIELHNYGTAEEQLTKLAIECNTLTFTTSLQDFITICTSFGRNAKVEHGDSGLVVAYCGPFRIMLSVE